MYVNGEMCWDASKLSTELGELLKAMKKNDEALEETLEKRVSSSLSQDEENLSLRLKEERLLDLTA